MLRKIIATISLLILIGLLAPYSFAEYTCPEEGKITDCAQVQTQTEAGLYVILEEPLGGPCANYCYRVCPIEKETVRMNTCTIQNDCSKVTDFTKQSCQRIQVIKADSGSNLIYQYVRMIYLWGAGTIGIVAVFTMVYSGIAISASAGGDIASHKQRIMQSLMGLVILFLSGLILYTINPTFFV